MSNLIDAHARLINTKLRESATSKKKLEEASSRALQLADFYDDSENAEIMERWLAERGLLKLFNNSALESTPDMFDEILDDTEQVELLDFISSGGAINDEESLINLLTELLYGARGIRNVRSFEEAGIMTRNLGVVITVDSGRDYQLQLNGSWR